MAGALGRSKTDKMTYPGNLREDDLMRRPALVPAPTGPGVLNRGGLPPDESAPEPAPRTAPRSDRRKWEDGDMNYGEMQGRKDRGIS